MWLHSRQHEKDMRVFNISEANDDDYGVGTREIVDDETVKINIIDFDNAYDVKQDGVTVYKKIEFQVSLQQLNDNDIDIIPGRTFIEYKENEYKVMDIQDYTRFNQIRLLEGWAMRTIEENAYP